MILLAIFCQTIAPNWRQSTSLLQIACGCLHCKTDNDPMVVSFLQWFIPLRQSEKLWLN